MRSASRIRYLLPTLLALGVLYYYSTHLHSPIITPPQRLPGERYVWRGWPSQQIGTERPSWGALRQVGAQQRIKENLRKDKKYLITFTLSGWNNQVLDMFNQIDLAVRSDRIPVLAPFYPNFVHYDELKTKDLPVGRVFNLKHLSTVLSNLPIVEAHELKRIWAMADEHSIVTYDGEIPQPPGIMITKLKKGEPIPPENWGDQDEVLGCWSYYGHYGFDGSAPMERFGLDLQYTPLPSTLFSTRQDMVPVPLQAIADLLRQDLTTIPIASLETLSKYPVLLDPTVPPDTHLACIDSAYWMQEHPGATDLHGEWRDAGAVWQGVGRHALFREELQNLADAALVDLLGLDKAGDIPPYIAIHIRRGDFGPEWMHLTPRHYAFFAQRVRKAISKEKGVDVQHIVVATDEEDPGWLRALRDFGWTLTQDYVAWKNADEDDEWLPIILDSIILSRGIGFAGPSSSTMSILSYLRVKEWQHGVSHLIRPHDPVPDGWSWSWGLVDA